jgi:hypothetical protein
MPDFPSNSKSTPSRPAQPEKVVEQVVVSEAATRKKSLGRRLREIFIGGDSKSVVNYIVADVLVPQAKDMIVEALSTGFERMIYGEGPRSPRRPGGYRPNVGPGPTNYTRYADRGNNPIGSHRVADRQPSASLRTQSIDDILLATRVEADAVLERMFDILENYDAVSVADLHGLVGWTSTHTDQKWGWTELHGADVRRVRDGYILILPKTVPLD